MKRKPKIEGLVEIETAAEAIGVSVAWLRGSARRGDVPCVYLAKRPHFHVDSVVRAIMKMAMGISKDDEGKGS
jgi:hypothetical protein